MIYGFMLVQDVYDEGEVSAVKSKRGQRKRRHEIPFSMWPLYLILLKISGVFFLTCAYFIATFSIETAYEGRVILAAHAVCTVKVLGIISLLHPLNKNSVPINNCRVLFMFGFLGELG